MAKSMPGLTNRFIPRWSCSIILFRCFFCRSSACSGATLFLSSSVTGISCILSTVMTRGSWVWAAFQSLQGKNRFAALASRFCKSSKKGPVFPHQNPTARYRYFPIFPCFNIVLHQNHLWDTVGSRQSGFTTHALVPSRNTVY